MKKMKLSCLDLNKIVKFFTYSAAARQDDLEILKGMTIVWDVFLSRAPFVFCLKTLSHYKLGPKLFKLQQWINLPTP